MSTLETTDNTTAKINDAIANVELMAVLLDNKEIAFLANYLIANSEDIKELYLEKIGA
jgi:hypothetical protein